MKTAVSVPDRLFRQAEAAAKRLKISRSRLYATALQEFLEQQNADAITARLNKVYSREDSGLDAGLQNAQINSLESERW